MATYRVETGVRRVVMGIVPLLLAGPYALAADSTVRTEVVRPPATTAADKGALTEDHAQLRDRVRRTLNDLHDWLDDSSQGPGWRRYLRSDQLLLQLGRGDEADPETLSRILERYRSEVPGLEQRHFAAVRSALEAWVASLETLPPEQLPQAARAAADDFEPITQVEVERARDQLLKSIRVAEAWLARRPPAEREELKQYLHWEDLKRQAQAGVQADADELFRILRHFFQDRPGLEQPEFLAVRADLQQFANLVQFSVPGVLASHQHQLNTLAEKLNAYLEMPTQDDAAEIGRLLDWLQRARQARPLVRAIRRHFGQPNFFARASERLVAAGFEDRVDQLAAVHQSILGTAVRGQARTRGRITAELVPNDRQAAVRLRMVGQAHSDNVGYNKGVRVYTTGVTSIQAFKMLYLDENGIHDRPATAFCETDTHINGVGAKCGLIERIALKRAQQSQGTAERIASRHAEQRVSNQVDEQAEELVSDSNRRFQQRIRTPLRRRGVEPQLMQVRSTADEVLIRAVASNAQQIAASHLPPELPGSPDLAIRLHESAVANYSESLIARETVTDADIREFLERNNREVPPELSPTAEAFSMTFHREQPIRVQLGGELLVITLRGSLFTRGGDGGSPKRELRRRYDISASYKFARTAEGPVLQRQGDVVVDFPNLRGLGLEELAFKPLMSNKSQALFRDTIRLDGWELPGRWKNAGKMTLDQWNTGDGWLSASWLQSNPPTMTAGSQTTGVRTAAR